MLYQGTLFQLSRCTSRSLVPLSTLGTRCQRKAGTAKMFQVRSQQVSSSNQEIETLETRTEGSGKDNSPDMMQEVMRGILEDCNHLFDDVGIDPSRYEDQVDFQDPITRYGSVAGYQFNIQFLRFVLAPKFEVHDLRQTGEYQVTTRWTMTMKFPWNQNSPIKKWWNPSLAFTGISIYTINPATGKILSHVDYWDSIDNQNYFSIEGFLQVLQQVLNLQRTPDVETPSYQLLKKLQSYEVRRYEPFLAAEVRMPAQELPDNRKRNSNASQQRSSFGKLAGFLFGENEKGLKMKMTSPVLSDTQGTMRFIIGKNDYEDLDQVPKPLNDQVGLSRQDECLYCAVNFNGTSDPQRVTQLAEQLVSRMKRDGLTPAEGFTLARYNDPRVNPLFRRNEILVKIEDGFRLW